MANTVGILLPVRLETRFDKDAAGAWQLRLRITPDEPAIDRHRDSVSRHEWASVTRFWQTIATTPLAAGTPPVEWFQSETAATAWERLCQQVSPARAAWLVSAFPPSVSAAGTAELSDPPLLGKPAEHNIIRGFPDSYDVWAVFGANPPVRLAEVVVPNPRDIPLRPLQAAANGEAADEWWSSWTLALDMKLAVECPLQGDPADLRVLFVVGLANERPGELFRRKTASGELAILEPSIATNTVRGEPAAPLHDQPHEWFDLVQARLSGALRPASQSVSRSLTGKPDALLPVPGDDTRFPQPGPALVQGLWSALWGHALRDVGGLASAAEDLGVWAKDFLLPEGPLPPIRIRNQPYGLLPVTAFGRWEADPLDVAFAPVEKQLLGRLLPVRDDLARAAHDRGNAVGADTQGLLDVLARDGVTRDYGYRDLLPRELAEAVLKLTFALAGKTYDPAKFEDWLKTTGFLAVHGWHPEHFLIADGDWHLLRLPLIHGKMPCPLRELVQRLNFPDAFANFVVERLQGTLPQSLLVRLMLWSAWLNKAAVVLEDGHAPAGVLPNPLLLFEPPIISDRTIDLIDFKAEVTEFDRLKTRWSPAVGPATSAHRILRMMDQGFGEIGRWFDDPQADQARLEQAFRAVLDTAMHRIDPWLVGVAWRRLLNVSASASFQLGIYGWVEGPIRGQPGPTAGGWLHAPSQRQALTAAILRDKFLSQQVAADGRNAWHMDLASQPVRLADQLAEEVRIGAHLWEVVGRQVERIVGTRDGVALLRGTYRQDPARFDPNVVCHGPNALKGLLTAPPAGLVPNADQRSALQGLDAALDAYGDLLVSEAVYRVVNGQAEAAGAAMDAAIGLQRPPTLDFIRTPRTGRSVSTSVLSRLPAVDPPADAQVNADSSPGALADASVAQYLIDYWGDATTWIFAANAKQVSLADLGLQPIDAVVLPGKTLMELMTAALETELARPAAGAATNVLKQQVQARELVQNLGRHPALGRDFLTEPLAPQDAAAADALDASIRDQLYARLNQVRQAATLLLSRLNAAANPADTLSALRRALGWGLVPQLSDDERPAFFVGLLAAQPAPGFLNKFGDRLPQMAKDAALGLGKRLQSMPDVPTLKTARTDAARIAAAVSELAAPGGQLAVLGVIDTPGLVAIAHLAPAADPALQLDWLPLVAAVRPSLARLEAWILEQELSGAVGLASWSSAPGDHWQTAFLQANPSVKVSEAKFPRFVAAYGPAAAAQAPRVAVGVIDAWSETVPRSEQSTSVTFGFNAPGARAPQAILLAVPPRLDQPLDGETLRDVILETRTLTLARAASFDDLGQYQALAPTLVFPSRGTTAVRTSTEFRWPVPD
jgi:hypothetical protein